jgi:hypothetical protein
VFDFTIAAAVLSLLYDAVLVLDRLHAMGVICPRLNSQILSSPNGCEVSLPCMETLQASHTCLSVLLRAVCLCDCSVFVAMRRLKLAIRDPFYSTSATSVYSKTNFGRPLKQTENKTNVAKQPRIHDTQRHVVKSQEQN